jgi:hypothetical protein
MVKTEFPRTELSRLKCGCKNALKEMHKEVVSQIHRIPCRMCFTAHLGLSPSPRYVLESKSETKA